MLEFSAAKLPRFSSRRLSGPLVKENCTACDSLRMADMMGAPGPALWAKMLPWSAGMLCKRMEMDQNGWSSKSDFILSHPLTIGQATLLTSFRQSIHRRLN